MKSASPRRQVKYHNPKGLITNFLIKLDRGKQTAHPTTRRHNLVPPSREKENRVFISPSPATTRKLQRLKHSAANNRARMVPAEINPLQQPSNHLKRASSNDCIVLSSDSELDEAPPRVAAPKRRCIRSKEITATGLVTVPLNGDVSEVFDMGKISIDQSKLPHWLRDPSDDESCDSDCSLVSTSALYHPKKRVRISSDCDLPSLLSPSFHLSLDSCSNCSSPALPDSAFQNLSMDDPTAPSSPALPVESFSSQSSLINSITPQVQPSVDDPAASAVVTPPIDCAPLLTKPPFIEDLNLILSRRGLLSVVKRAESHNTRRLFTLYQENTVEQLLTLELFSLHQRILNTADYLKQILSCRRMPQAKLLSLLWSSAVNLGDEFDAAGNAIAEVFRLIVMAHPPSVKTCRQEYQKFLQIVNSKDLNCLWEQLSSAINGPSWKVALASSLVDILLIDYHTLHTSSDVTSSSAVLPPLFHTLFWRAAGSSGTITRPIRQLLEMTATSENNINHEKACCCHSLVFLVATACRSISFELALYLGQLPVELLHSAITRVLPGSLRLAIFNLLSDKLSLSPPIRQIMNQIITKMHTSPPTEAFHFSHS